MNEEQNNEAVKTAKINPSIVISIISLVLSTVSLSFVIYPQLFPNNKNMINRANANDVSAQAFLAQFYYDTGDAEQCYYWNEIIAMGTSDYSGKACNNLAYLKLTFGSQLPYFSDYYSKAYDLFIKAGEMGEYYGYQNAYILLCATPEQFFPDLDVKARRNELFDILTLDPRYDHDAVCSYSTEWKHPKVITTNRVMTDTPSTKYVLIGNRELYGEMIYSYQVYEAKDDIPMIDYTYIEME